LPLDKTAFDIDCEKTCAKIENFIQEMVAKSNTKGLVLGLSGGIDSSVVAALAVRAIGKEKVLGLILPNDSLHPDFEKDARELAEQLGIDVKKIPLSDFEAVFVKNIDDELKEEKLVLGNAMARFRMILLYAYANYLGYLVLGTSNKTEILVGYITKYGDGGVDFEPCGGLYKTQIRTLAKYLNIPKAIIAKPPTAGLWDGQTDEGELGITYDNLDLILLAMEIGYTKKQIMKELNFEKELVDKVEGLVKRSEHKRHIPPILEFD